MHKDQLTHAVMTPHTDFLITAGVDGVVKFWKKGGRSEGVEFVKEFRVHGGAAAGEEEEDGMGGVRHVAVSADGRSFASAGPAGAGAKATTGVSDGLEGKSGSVCVWDVVNFGTDQKCVESTAGGSLMHDRPCHHDCDLKACLINLLGSQERRLSAITRYR